MTVDIMIVGVYFLFLIAIGYFFKKYASNSTSDYFSGGGKMLWWMVGATAFMTQFSAWTFTGAAGKAFEDGWAIVILFMANAAGYFACYFIFAPKARQLRIVTPMEGIRMRYGKVNEQVFTWFNMPSSILGAAVWLNGLAIFVSAVFGISVQHTIIATGVVVLLMSVTGGAWAVIASDFMQLVTIMAVTLACAVVAVVKGGGFTNMMSLGLPEQPIMGNGMNYTSLFIAWVVILLCRQIFNIGSLTGGAYRYFSAKDTESAKKAALLAGVLMLVGPIIWFIPAWFVAGHYPDPTTWGLSNLGSSIKDGAYLVFVRNEMPAGMVGLMMSGIFAATMSSMDSALNRNAGIIIKNFYVPVINKDASEEKLLVLSKLTTVLFGVVIIGASLFISTLKNLSLFNATMYIGSLLAFPILIPGILGYFIKKTPDWAGWGSLLVGSLVSYWVAMFDFSILENLFGLEQAFTGRELSDFRVVLAFVAHIVVTGGFFAGSTLFFKGFKDPEREEEHNRFFSNMNTPVVAKANAESEECDNGQRAILGKLIVTFGCGITLLSLFPNEMWGRTVFILVGIIVATVGVGLIKSVSVCKKPRVATEAG